MPNFKRFSPYLGFCGLIFLSAILVIPPFLNDYLVSHDLLYHLQWNELFKRQLFNGDLYPRWLFGMNGGRGSPVFFFYSPLPYYTSAFFSLFTFGEHASWYALGATYWFALLISSAGVYKFLRIYVEPTIAYLCTLFYILFPYHVVIDLYIRFAFAEFFAISWIPFLFLYTKRLAEGDSTASTKIAVTYLLVILSHIPTTLLITPTIIIYYMIEKSLREKFFSIFPPLLYGIGMASFYLIPVTFLKKYVSIPGMFNERGFFENAFLLVGGELYPNWADFWFLLNRLTIISLVLTIICSLSLTKKSRVLLFFLIVSLLSIFMMYPLSTFVWEMIPIVQIVQFPWRFYIILSFTIIFISALILSDNHHRHKFNNYIKKITIVVLTGLSITTLINCHINSTGSVSAKHRKVINKSFITYEGATEYLPTGTPESIAMKIRDKTLSGNEPLFFSDSGNARLHYTFINNQFELSLASDKPLTLNFNQFYFPSWQCFETNNGLEVPLQKNKDGMISIFLKAGVYNLTFRQKMTYPEIFGILMTLSTLFWLLFTTQKRRQEQSIHVF